MNTLDNVVIGQPTPMTLRSVLELVISVIGPIITVDTSLSASPTDLALAEQTVSLASNIELTQQQIHATARVVALGTDYLRLHEAEIVAAYPSVALLMSYIPPDQVEQFTINVLTHGRSRNG